MPRRNRLVLLLALLLVVPFAACGTAEEPVENAVEEPAEPEPVVEEPAPVVEEPEAPEEPQEPELVGNIRLSGEDLAWGTPTQETAPYTWTVRVNNDTTATLDITVRFQLLDENDQVIKTESATVRLAPAQSRTVSQNGSLPYAQANNVFSYSSTFDYAIVES